MISKLALLSLVLACSVYADESGKPTIAKTIPLPGVEGRFDHAAYDAATHRLFFAALGNNTLEVVNVESAKRVHTISGMKKPTGVLFLAEWNIIVVANGDDGTCRFYDGTSYEEKGRIADVDDADNLRFDAKAKRIYLGYSEGALGVIDPANYKLINSIKLPKHPEAFQLESNGPRIFINVPDAKEVCVVDRDAGSIVATWPVTDAQANFPMALDEANHRIFIGCRQPAKLVCLDTATGKTTSAVTMSGDVDDIFYDAKSSQLYASCGEGFLDIFQIDSDSSVIRRAQLTTSTGARTCFANATDHWLALAVPHRGSQETELRIFKLVP